MPSLRCMIATPTRELFSDEVAYVEVPGAEGSYGVLPGHEMFLSTNAPGVVTVWMDEAGKEKRQFAVYEGATQVTGDMAVVLARFGADVDTIDPEVIKGKIENMKGVIADLGEPEDGGAWGAVLETSKSRLKWYETQLEAVAKK